jgi:hypothetical protein
MKQRQILSFILMKLVYSYAINNVNSQIREMKWKNYSQHTICLSFDSSRPELLTADLAGPVSFRVRVSGGENGREPFGGD